MKWNSLHAFAKTNMESDLTCESQGPSVDVSYLDVPRKRTDLCVGLLWY